MAKQQQWWESYVDAADEEDQYPERFGGGGRKHGTYLSDYLDRWNTGSGYGTWRSTSSVTDENKQNREKSKRTIAKNLNVLSNSTGSEKSLKLGFATSEETVNKTSSETV